MRTTPMLSLLFLFVFSLPQTICIGEESTSPEDVFNQRILPIFRSAEPSSCVQCHLASVDLKNYILPSHEKTFLSLRDQGLINLDSPSKSKILKLIQMGKKDLDEGAKLIHEKMRRQEEQAFATWIEVCCNDSALRNLPKLSADEYAKPDAPDGVIRHARKSRIVDSFARNIWSQRMRCFPCHTPHEIDPENPRHAIAIKKQKEMKETYGNRMSRLNIFKKTPEATLDFLITSSTQTAADSLPLLNLKDPRNSLIILKPTAKLPQKNPDGTFANPSSAIPVSHMGGLKMHPNDQTYKSFVAWISDYAKTVNGEYQTVDELPSDNWLPSKLILKLKETPKAWKVGTPVQLLLHQWDEADKSWSKNAIAFTQGTVTPRGMVNGALFLLDNSKSTEATSTNKEAELPRGPFLVRVYLDKKNRLEADPTIMLGADDFYGSTELDNKRWREGFRTGKIISAKNLQH